MASPSRPTGDARLSERDDRRHPAPSGQEGRDSLFFNVMMPTEELGVLLYTWTDGEGVAGRLVGIWGAGREALALDFVSGVAMGDADFDDWRVAALEVRNTEPLRAAQVRYRSERVEVAYDFTGIHEPFPYSRNAEGCPPWMAQDRFEQAGRVVGEVVVDGRCVSFDQLGHRDHSWGPRAWTVPQHWKWIAAQAEAGSGQYESLWPTEYIQRLGKPES